MRKITVDFSLQTYPLFAGYVGEHNATEITAIKPVDLEGVTYSLAFMTNGEVIHSEFFGADEEIKVTLWQQLTQDNCLFVQLEAYDENGKYLGKSGMVKLVLSNSVHGIDMIADADNPDVYSEIAQNSAFREMLENNVDTLDKLTTSSTGKLLFNGKPIEGTGGGSSEGGEISSDLVEQIEANTENRHWHDNKAVLDNFGVVNGYPVFKTTAPNTLAYTSDIPADMSVTDVYNAWNGQNLPIRSFLGNQALPTFINLIKSDITAIPKFSIAVVDALPTENISNTTVYLVKDTETDSNLYTEYIYINNTWEILGSQQIDLTNYRKADEPIPAEDISYSHDAYNSDNVKDALDAATDYVTTNIPALQASVEKKQDKGDYITSKDLKTAVDNSLAEAKANGDFKGEKGDKGDTGATGANGTNGKDGYTPVKGVDYWTDADKAEMVSAVISALPKYNGEVVAV